MTAPTPARRAELRALIEKATPGPWWASETYPAGEWCLHAIGIPWQLAYFHQSRMVDWPLEANANLVAAAVSALPALLDALDALERERDAAEARAKAAEGVIDAASPLFANLKEIVAGWHRYPGMERHPLDLRCTPGTTCGVVYAIVDALATLDKERPADAR